MCDPPHCKRESEMSFNCNNLLNVSITVLSMLLVGACFREGNRGYLELEARQDAFKPGTPMFVKDMKPDDVIVAVNGYPLTRKFLDGMSIGMARAMLSRPNANPREIDQRIEEMRPILVKQFVMRRLMIDEAKRLGLYTDKSLVEYMEGHLSKVASASGKTKEQIFEAMGESKDVYLYQTAERFVVDRLVAEKIPPLITVDAAFVSNVQEQVTLDNQAANLTNLNIKAVLGRCREEIVTGKADFDKAVLLHTNELAHIVSTGGKWGEFTVDDAKQNPAVKAAFALKEGEISLPIEEDDGFSIVRVAKIIPAEVSNYGKETRELDRIYVEKEPLIIRQSDNEMFKDLKQQMQMQAIYLFADQLATNGQNRVEYPHGEKLFP